MKKKLQPVCLTGLLSFALFLSCNKGNDLTAPNPANPLVGKWECLKLTNEYRFTAPYVYSSSQDQVYTHSQATKVELRSDSTFISEDPTSGTSYGIWYAENGKLYGYNFQRAATLDYSISNNELVLTSSPYPFSDGYNAGTVRGIGYFYRIQ